MSLQSAHLLRSLYNGAELFNTDCIKDCTFCCACLWPSYCHKDSLLAASHDLETSLPLTLITTVQLAHAVQSKKVICTLMETVTALCCFSINYNVRLQLICSAKLRSVPQNALEIQQSAICSQLTVTAYRRHIWQGVQQVAVAPSVNNTQSAVYLTLTFEL